MNDFPKSAGYGKAQQIYSWKSTLTRNAFRIETVNGMAYEYHLTFEESKRRYTSGEHSLTEEQVGILLQSIKDYTEQILIRLAVNTGIRRGDIVRLAWKDLNREQRKITFFEKKKNRVREVFISESMLSDLERLYTMQKGKEYYFFPGRSEKKYGKGHISDRTAYNVLHRACRMSGLKERPFHSLRATCIKLCQKRGWPPEATAKHVGDTIRVIQEHYSTPSDGEMMDVSNQKPIF